MMPSSSLPKLISFSEHIIPSETTPLSFDLFILNFLSPSCKVVPIFAIGTLIFFFTLGAPHTIFKISPPTSTLVTFSLSALGC